MLCFTINCLAVETNSFYKLLTSKRPADESGAVLYHNKRLLTVRAERGTAAVREPAATSAPRATCPSLSWRLFGQPELPGDQGARSLDVTGGTRPCRHLVDRPPDLGQGGGPPIRMPLEMVRPTEIGATDEQDRQIEQGNPRQQTQGQTIYQDLRDFTRPGARANLSNSTGRVSFQYSTTIGTKRRTTS